jgi:hypothetical protein
MTGWPEWPVTAWAAVVCGAVFVILVLWMLVGFNRGRSGTGTEPWLLRAPLLRLVLAVVSGLIALYSLLLLLAFGAEDFSLPDRANVASPVIVAATLIAGVLTAAYAVLKFRAHLLSEARGKIDAQEDHRADDKHRADQEFALIERFSKAVGLLATDKPISRIAGAHLVLALGDEWKSGTQRCFDVLTSHLRALGENEDDALSSPGVREEVRLITAELARRLTGAEAVWRIESWDFRGTVLGELNLAIAGGLKSLDFTGARVLGDLSLTRPADSVVPVLAGIECDGDLALSWDFDTMDRPVDAVRDTLNLSSARVGGSLSVAGHILDYDLRVTDTEVGGELSLAFEEFTANIYLDQMVIGGEARIGSKTLRTSFSQPPTGGDSRAATSLTVADSTFSSLRLCNAVPGPQLDLSGAAGYVDLSHSRFSSEVTANDLDASAGLSLRQTRFDATLILDRATLPEAMEIEGLQLSQQARSGLESSEFPFLELLFESAEADTAPVVAAVPVVASNGFGWRAVLDSLRDDYPASFFEQLERRLERLETDIPVDWQARETFAAGVMSAVSRAAAIADLADSDTVQVQAALRSGLGLPDEAQISR